MPFRALTSFRSPSPVIPIPQPCHSERSRGISPFAPRRGTRSAANAGGCPPRKPAPSHHSRPIAPPFLALPAIPIPSRCHPEPLILSFRSLPCHSERSRGISPFENRRGTRSAANAGGCPPRKPAPSHHSDPLPCHSRPSPVIPSPSSCHSERSEESPHPSHPSQSSTS